MDIERNLRDALQRLDDRWSHREVGDEVAVHHVDVNQVGAPAFDGGNRSAQRRKIG